MPIALPVLIAEDDPAVARFLRQAVTEAGYSVRVVEDGLSALEQLITVTFSLVLLDVMLPGLDGFTVCRRIRAKGVSTPILLITARDALEDKIEGLDSGADDYIVKPFQLGELLARMRALLRRERPESSQRTGDGNELYNSIVRVGDLVVDSDACRVTRGGKTITLSVTEYTLLDYLARNAGRVLTRSMILEHVWHYDFEGKDNVLDVYISYLRTKIDRGHAVSLIHTVRGVGYRLDAANHAE